jgi:GNAT superfamily N-acetyltransferase
MVLRPITPEDAQAACDVIHATIDGVYTPVYPPRTIQFFKIFHSVDSITERAQKGHILVVEQEGSIVGTAASLENRIFGMFVLPDFQGRGYGRDLMDALETQIKADGHTEAVLSMSLPSEGFYRSRGYIDFEEYSRDVGGGEMLVFSDAKKRL